jgi:hypothetical protein
MPMGQWWVEGGAGASRAPLPISRVCETQVGLLKAAAKCIYVHFASSIAIVDWLQLSCVLHHARYPFPQNALFHGLLEMENL